MLQCVSISCIVNRVLIFCIANLVLVYLAVWDTQMTGFVPKAIYHLLALGWKMYIEHSQSWIHGSALHLIYIKIYMLGEKPGPSCNFSLWPQQAPCFSPDGHCNSFQFTTGLAECVGSCYHGATCGALANFFLSLKRPCQKGISGRKMGRHWKKRVSAKDCRRSRQPWAVLMRPGLRSVLSQLFLSSSVLCKGKQQIWLLTQYAFFSKVWIYMNV